MGQDVILIDSNPARASVLERSLHNHGHKVVGRLPLSADIPGRIGGARGDVVILDTERPDETTLDVAQTVIRELNSPVIIFAEHGSSKMIDAAIHAGVSAFIVNGLNPARLTPIMDVAIARFKHEAHLREELEAIRGRLADSEDINRARDILMHQRGLEATEADQALKRISVGCNQSLGAAARYVINASERLN